MDDVIKLISNSYQQDRMGVRRPFETARTVMCEVLEVTRAEFFAAGRNGLNPEYTFRVSTVDYEKELICEFHGERFAIYRTYKADADKTELYVQKEGGLNGKKESQTATA